MNNPATIKSTVEEMQLNAKQFLNKNYIEVNNISIYPKDIEVYYYKEVQFEDDSVHRNELQKNNFNHLYVHRFGKTATNPYKGRAGIDLCLSNQDNFYLTYLLRSAVINNELVIGPNNVLKAIIKHTNMTPKELESCMCKICNQNELECNVYYSERINLSSKVSPKFANLYLRAVIDDDYFIKAKYPRKEHMITNFLNKEMKMGIMTNQQALDYSKKHLNYYLNIFKEESK